VGDPLRREPGGIVGLLTLPRHYWEAIEADLLAMGWTLADIPRRVSWRALLAYTRTAPRTSALYRVANPEAREWSPSDWLLADVVDQLQYLRYSLSGKGAKRPKPISRPGVEDKETTTFGGSHMELDEMKKWLGW
jgi:hypothetical protein